MGETHGKGEVRFPALKGPTKACKVRLGLVNPIRGWALSWSPGTVGFRPQVLTVHRSAVKGSMPLTAGNRQVAADWNARRLAVKGASKVSGDNLLILNRLIA